MGETYSVKKSTDTTAYYSEPTVGKTRPPLPPRVGTRSASAPQRPLPAPPPVGTSSEQPIRNPRSPPSPRVQPQARQAYSTIKKKGVPRDPTAAKPAEPTRPPSPLVPTSHLKRPPPAVIRSRAQIPAPAPSTPQTGRKPAEIRQFKGNKPLNLPTATKWRGEAPTILRKDVKKTKEGVQEVSKKKTERMEAVMDTEREKTLSTFWGEYVSTEKKYQTDVSKGIGYFSNLDKVKLKQDLAEYNAMRKTAGEPELSTADLKGYVRALRRVYREAKANTAKLEKLSSQPDKVQAILSHLKSKEFNTLAEACKDHILNYDSKNSLILDFMTYHQNKEEYAKNKLMQKEIDDAAKKGIRIVKDAKFVPFADKSTKLEDASSPTLSFQLVTRMDMLTRTVVDKVPATHPHRKPLATMGVKLRNKLKHVNEIKFANEKKRAQEAAAKAAPAPATPEKRKSKGFFKKLFG